MYYKVISVLLLTGLMASAASSSETRNFYFGTALHHTMVGFQADYHASNEYESVHPYLGTTAYVGAAFNDYLGIRGLAGFQSPFRYDAYDSVFLTEVTLQAGIGLATEGFKAYGSAGAFSELWRVGKHYNERVSGGVIGAGLGYNWEPIALDLWFHIRDASQYEDSFVPNNDLSAEAQSVGVALTGRF